MAAVVNLAILFAVIVSVAASSDVKSVSKANAVDSLSEFVLDCLHFPWICSPGDDTLHLVLVDQSGKFLQEKGVSSSSGVEIVAERDRLPKPKRKSVKKSRYPNYVLRLIPSGDQQDSFYVRSSSGRILVTRSDAGPPQLILADDTCTAQQQGNETVQSQQEMYLPTLAAAEADPCLGATWKLDKLQDTYIQFRSVIDSTLGLKVKSGTLVLSEDEPELFTGINTNFLTRISLDKGDRTSTNGSSVASADGSPQTLSGDLLVYSRDRDGHEKGPHYVCDHGWNRKAAEAACRDLGFQAGLPTYDGRHSANWNTSGTVFAVSGVKCGKLATSVLRSGCDGDASECRFKTRSSPARYIVQRRAAFEYAGKGYACGPRDRAGVVCGSAVHVSDLSSSSARCKSVGRDAFDVFSLTSQAQKVSNQINAGRHWSEYLTPIPYTVALMTSVVLQSGQLTATVVLQTPLGTQQFRHLRWSTFKANLMQVSFEVAKSFNNMNRVKINCRKIEEDLFDAVSLAFSDEKYDYQTLLPRTLNWVSDSSAESHRLALEVVGSFAHTTEVLQELFEAVLATEERNSNEARLIRREVDAIRKRNKKLREEIEKSEQAKKEYGDRLRNATDAFYAAARDALDKECVDGDLVCEECEYREEKEGNSCLVQEVEVCTRYEDRCVEMEVDRFELGIQGFGSIGFNTGSTCVRQEPVCVGSHFVCPQKDFQKAGRYCKDTQKICGACTFNSGIRKTMARVVEASMKLEVDDAFGSDYRTLADQIRLLLESLRGIIVDVSSWASFVSAAAPANASSAAFPPSPLRNVTDRNLTARLVAFKSHCGVALVSLTRLEEGELRSKVQEWMHALESSAGRMMDGGVQTSSQVEEGEFEHLNELAADGRELLEAVEQKAREKLATTTGLEGGGQAGSAGAATAELAKEAQAMLSNQKEYNKFAYWVERDVDMLREGIMFVLGKSAEELSLREIIPYLQEVAVHLSKMQEHWGDISEFFKKTAAILRSGREEVGRVILYYRDLQEDRSVIDDVKRSFLSRLQEKAVMATAYNSYAYRLATFYTKLAENGLIQELDGIGTNLQQIEDPKALNRYKNFIMRKARAEEAKILREVENEERILSSEMFEKVAKMKRSLICAAEERKKVAEEVMEEASAAATESERRTKLQEAAVAAEEAALLTNSVMDVEAAENDANNVKEVIGRAEEEGNEEEHVLVVVAKKKDESDEKEEENDIWLDDAYFTNVVTR